MFIGNNNNNLSKAGSTAKPESSRQKTRHIQCVYVCGWFSKTVMLIDPFTDRFSSERNAWMEQTEHLGFKKKFFTDTTAVWVSVFTEELTQRFIQQSCESG